MKSFSPLLLLALGVGAKLQYGPQALANHEAGPRASCDPDYGWLPGAEGSNKCYMMIRSFDTNNCHSGDEWGYGMDFFDAMQCCYFQHGYLAEPLSEEENTQIKTYLLMANGGDANNYWWIGGTDMHHEGDWSWLSGAPWMFEAWGEGEPNQSGNEDCTAYNGQAGNTWMDLSCEQDDVLGMPTHVICEKLLE